MCGDEVTNKNEDGHDHVLSNGYHVRSGDFSDGDTAIGGIRGVQVDVVGTNTGGHGELKVLGLGKTLCGKIARVEAVGYQLSQLHEVLESGV